jgi:hypothetical protein
MGENNNKGPQKRIVDWAVPSQICQDFFASQHLFIRLLFFWKDGTRTYHTSVKSGERRNAISGNGALVHRPAFSRKKFPITQLWRVRRRTTLGAPLKSAGVPAATCFSGKIRGEKPVGFFKIKVPVNRAY